MRLTFQYATVAPWKWNCQTAAAATARSLTRTRTPLGLRLGLGLGLDLAMAMAIAAVAAVQLGLGLFPLPVGLCLGDLLRICGFGFGRCGDCIHRKRSRAEMKGRLPAICLPPSLPLSPFSLVATGTKGHYNLTYKADIRHTKNCTFSH